MMQKIRKSQYVITYTLVPRTLHVIWPPKQPAAHNNHFQSKLALDLQTCTIKCFYKRCKSCFFIQLCPLNPQFFPAHLHFRFLFCLNSLAFMQKIFNGNENRLFRKGSIGSCCLILSYQHKDFLIVILWTKCVGHSY